MKKYKIIDHRTGETPPRWQNGDAYVFVYTNSFRTIILNNVNSTTRGIQFNLATFEEFKKYTGMTDEEYVELKLKYGKHDCLKKLKLRYGNNNFHHLQVKYQ